MNVKKMIVIGITVLCTGILVACGGESEKNTASEKDGEQVFRYIERQEMPSADPSLATDEVSLVALNNIYEGIYRLDKENKPQPAGAVEAATVSDDGLTYTVKLREDARWTDDKPVTAADYVYSWQRTVDPKTASEYAFMFYSIKNAEKINKGELNKEELGIKAMNEYELEITLEKVTPYFDYLLAFPSFVPQRKDIVEKYGEEYTTTSNKAVYNGPFVLTDFDGPGTDTNWSYTKNDHYWDKETMKIEKVMVDVVKEAPTSLNLFQDDQSDDVPLTGELAEQMKEDPNYIVLKMASTFYLETNQKDEQSPYRNENLRKALSYALDRDAMVNQIIANGSTVATGLVPEGLAGNPTTDEDFAKEAGNKVVYDASKAKASWEKAKSDLGIDTLSIDLLVDDTDNSKKLAEYIQGTLTDTLDGLKVTVTTVPFSVRLDRMTNGDFEVAISGWTADYADPSSFLDLFLTGNAYNKGYYSNKDYDELVTKAATVDANDPKARWKDMIDAEKLLMDQMAIIPLYQKAEAHLRSENVKDIVYHSTGARYDFKWMYMDE